jgi:predicted dehydrogenase
LNAFVEVVIQQKKPPVDFEDGRLALVLADAAWTSLQNGRAVRITYD